MSLYFGALHNTAMPSTPPERPLSKLSSLSLSHCFPLHSTSNCHLADHLCYHELSFCLPLYLSLLSPSKQLLRQTWMPSMTGTRLPKPTCRKSCELFNSVVIRWSSQAMYDMQWPAMAQTLTPQMCFHLLLTADKSSMKDIRSVVMTTAPNIRSLGEKSWSVGEDRKC